MSADRRTPITSPSARWVRSGEDRFGERFGNGIGTIAFKVTTRESSDLFVMEMALYDKGAQRGTYTSDRTSGSTLSRASSSSRWGMIALD